MSREVSITCDACGNDLARSSNCEDYRLALTNELVPNGGGFVHAMCAYPAIDRDVHFCNVDCLRTWLDEKYPADKAPYHRGKLGAKARQRERATARQAQEPKP